MSGHIQRADPAGGAAMPRARAVVLTGGASCFCAGDGEIAALPADAVRLTKARQALLDKRNPRINLDVATER